jgi:asparagine synthase (glutamine-hydrolysing)
MMLHARLSQVLFDVVNAATKDNGPIAIAFSGGIDSSLLATICKKNEISVTLLTIGFPQSHDVCFSKRIASKLNQDHRINILEENDFYENLGEVIKKVNCENISHIENCMAFFYVAKFAQEEGFRTVLSANGCDELFCGYDIYRTTFNNGRTRLMQLMEEKILNEFRLIHEIDKTVNDFGVKISQPFLSNKIIAFSRDIPIEDKILGANDYLRKRILRKVARILSVPKESTLKKKKAMQYGTNIHKKVRKYLNNMITEQHP